VREHEASNMNDENSDYKAEVNPDIKATLEWQSDLVFSSSTQKGYDLDFDANNQMGCMPIEGLLLSLAGCMAIDVIAILDKMRCKPDTFSMDIQGERNPTPPQRITRIHLVLNMTGDNLQEEKVRRAVSLSEEKYCSVKHSLREDIEVTTDIRINAT
jgi:putative redox protein